MAAIYYNDIEPNLKQGAALAFAHGFNVHYNQIMPRADVDVDHDRPQGPRPPGALRPTPRAAACPR